MIVSTLILVAVGAAESVVHLWRIRSAVGDAPAWSALHAGIVTLLRAVFVAVGVGAVLQDAGYVSLLVAYPVSVVAATWVTHLWLNQRSRS